MPEHSETTHTPSTKRSMQKSTHLVTAATGLRVAVACAGRIPLPDGTWIETMITPQGYLAVSLVQEIKDATP